MLVLPAAGAAHSAGAAPEEGLEDLVGVDVLREGVTAAVAVEVLNVVAVVVPAGEKYNFLVNVLIGWKWNMRYVHM